MDLEGNAFKAKSLNWKYLVLFFLIAFGWTWFWWYRFISGVLTMPAGTGTPEFDLKFSPVLLIVLISPFGPTLAAFIVTAISEGKQGVRALWQRFTKGGFSWKWLLVLLLFYIILKLIIRYSSLWLFGVAQPDYTYIKTPWILIPPILASILHGGLSEEFGWRGYALRHLQAKYSAVASALLLGFIEGCWHIPLVFMAGDERFGMSLPALIFPYLAVGIFRAWIFNNTRGSVWAAVLFHMTGNVAWMIVPMNIPYSFFGDMVYLLAASFIVLGFGMQDLKVSKSG